MNNFTANSVLDRLQLAMGVNSDSALSKALGVNRATLGNWRSRDSTPYAICVNYAINNGVSLNWLLAGQGEMLFNAAEQFTETLGESRTKLIELFEYLSADQQQETFLYLMDKNRLNTLEKIVQDLQLKITPSL